MEELIPIIIPAYEPDEKLINLLNSLKEAGFKNLVIVDDGSGDNYRPVFDEAEQGYQCIILRHAINLGKGRALKTAFNYCLNAFSQAQGCITADSDGQHSAACILACAEALVKQPHTLVLGCRSFDGEDIPARSEFGNKCTRVVMKYLTGISVSDTQTGLRAIPQEFMKYLLQVKGERFEFETNMLMAAKSERVPIVEIPIRTIYIEENRTSHFHPVKDSIRIYMIFARFLFSSLSSSVLDLVLFSLFCYMLKEGDWELVSYIATATVLARILSALYNYYINYKMVFQSKNSVAATIWKYIILAVVQMACSAFFVNMLYPLFGGLEVLVKMPVDIGLFFISFIIQREFVYK